MEKEPIIKNANDKLYLSVIGVLFAIPFVYLIVTSLTETKESSIFTPIETKPTNDVESKINEAIQLAQNQPTETNHINLSLLFINNQQYAKGIEACEKVLTMNPKKVIALNNLGFAQTMLKKFPDAEKNLRKALELDPSFELAKNNLNMLLVQKEKLGTP